MDSPILPLQQAIAAILGAGVSYPILLRDDTGIKETKPIAYRSSIMDFHYESPYICLTQKVIREMSYMSPHFKWQTISETDSNWKYVSFNIDKLDPIRVGMLWGYVIPIKSTQYTKINEGESTHVCVIHGCKELFNIPLANLDEWNATESLEEKSLRHKLWYILENAPQLTGAEALELLTEELKQTTTINPESSYTGNTNKIKPVLCGLTFSHGYDIKSIIGHRLWETLNTRFMDTLYRYSLEEYRDPCELHLTPPRSIELACSAYMPLQIIELGIKGLAKITGGLHSSISYESDDIEYPPVVLKEVTATDIETITNDSDPYLPCPIMHGNTAIEKVIKDCLEDFAEFIGDFDKDPDATGIDSLVFNAGSVS